MATPEQIRAAHEAARAIQSQLMALAAGPVFVQYEFNYKIDSPMPEPERPRITPARELAKRIAEEDDYSTSRVLAAQRAIAEARAEIIALLEWELGELPREDGEVLSGQATGREQAYLKLIQQLRDGDTP